jgi:hypothetical protein
MELGQTILVFNVFENLRRFDEEKSSSFGFECELRIEDDLYHRVLDHHLVAIGPVQ